MAEEHRNDMELDLIESCSAFCMDDPHRFQEPSLNPSGAAPSPRVAASAAAVAAVLALVMAGFGGASVSIYFTSWRCSVSPAISGKATA